MPIYNHYYSRGYVIDKSSDGKHKVPSSRSQGSGYSTVGCSSGLKNTIIDLLESSSFMDFSAGGDASTRSLYLYPHFSESKGVRFAMLGQALTHPEGNFADQRASYFVHNCIIGLADLRDIIAARTPESILNHSFKDTYVDHKERYAENELSAPKCIDTPAELGEFLRQSSKNNLYSPATLSFEFAKALVVGLSRNKAHCAIKISNASNVDASARAILYSLYKWMPQKILQNLGFITCLNSSKSHKTCNLIFCTPNEYSEIQARGLGEIRANEIVFIDPDQCRNIAESTSGYNQDDIAYIDWLAKCLSGGYSAQDEIIRDKTDVQELLIDQRAVPFGLLSKIHNLVVCHNDYQVSYGEDSSRALGIAAFALLKVTAESVPSCLEKLLPAISIGLDKTILGGEVDNLIIQIDSKFPGLIDKLTPHLSAEVNESISEIRIYKSTLTTLRNMCNSTTSAKNLVRIIEGAKIKYRENKYDRSEVGFGYEIGLFALKKTNWSKDTQDLCKELFALTFAAASSNGVKLFSSTSNLEGVIDALCAIQLARNSVTVKDCASIVSDIASTANEQPYNVMRRLIQNTKTLPVRGASNTTVSALLTYIYKLCASTNYDTQILLPFCKLLESQEAYSDVWNLVADLSAQIFILCVTKDAEAFKTLRGVIPVVNASRKTSAFVEKIAPALTMLIVSKPLNESAHNKSVHDYRAIIAEIYSSIFADCTEEYINAPAKAVKDIICTRTIEAVNNYQVDPIVADRYRQTPIRERATALEAVCTRKAKVNNLDGFKCFQLHLGIPGYPEYVRSGGVDGVVENLYRAFAGDEDRKEYISARIRDMQASCKLGTHGVFSNNESARCNALSKIIAQKGKDSELYQSFAEALQQMFNDEAGLLSASTDSCAAFWSKYIALITNSLIYDFGTHIDLNSLLNNAAFVQRSTANSNVSISEICKCFSDAKDSINTYADADRAMYDELLRLTYSSRKHLDDEVSRGIICINPYLDIAQLVSSDLIDMAIELFPNAMAGMLDSIEFGWKNGSKSSIKVLSNKLHQKQNNPYCKDIQTDERLRLFLKKHPKSNTGKWIAVAASVVLVAAMGLILPNMFNSDKPAPPVITWEYHLTSGEYAPYLSEIVDNGDVVNVYQMVRVGDGITENNCISSADTQTSGTDIETFGADAENKKLVYNCIKASETDCFGYNNHYARVVLAYVTPICSDSDASLNVITTEEIRVVLSGSDLLIDESQIDQEAIANDSAIYIAQVQNWDPVVKNEELEYPTIEDALCDIGNNESATLSFSDVDGQSPTPSNSDSAEEVKVHTLQLLCNQEISETIAVTENIKLESIGENNITIKRSPGFNDEIFSINDGASLTLNGITLDGGAEWETVQPTENESTDAAPESDVKISLTTAQYCIVSDTDLSVAITIENESENNIADLSFDLVYEQGNVSFTSIPSNEDFDIVASPEGDGVIHISFPKISDEAEGEQKVIEPGKSITIDLSYLISADMQAEQSTGMRIESASAHFLDSEPVDSDSDASNSGIITTECSIHTLPACSIMVCSNDMLESIVPIADQIPIEIIDFAPNSLDCFVEIPRDTTSIDFRLATFGNSATTAEIVPNGTLGIDDEVEFKFIVSCEENGDSREYSVYVRFEDPVTENINDRVILNGQVNVGTTASKPLIANNGTLTITRDSILQNNCVMVGDEETAGALINRGDAVIFGFINGNSAIGNDSAICVGGVYNYGHLTLHGNVESNCADGSRSVGGIVNSSTGTTDILESSITARNSAIDVGGILNSGEINMTGGTVTANSALKNGVGGVKNEKYKGLNISGATRISENYIRDTDGFSNVLTKHPIMVTGELDNAVIGISNSSKTTFAEGSTTIMLSHYINCFYADDFDSYAIEVTSNGRCLSFNKDTPVNYYKVTVNGADNGYVSYTGTRRIGADQICKLHIQPNDLYMLEDIVVVNSVGESNSVMDQAVQIEEGKSYSYEIKDLSDDIIVSITFKPQAEYAWSIKHSDGGDLTVKDSSETVVDESTMLVGGTYAKVIIAPHEGYEFAFLKVNDDEIDKAQIKTYDDGSISYEWYVRESVKIDVGFVPVATDVSPSDVIQ